LHEKLNTWAVCKDIAVINAPQADAQVYVPVMPVKSEAATSARSPSRALPNAGWTASFSALTRYLSESNLPSTDSGLARAERWLDSQLDNAVSQPDELFLAEGAASSTTEVPPYNEFPAGSAYGTLLHDIFEWQLKEAWPLLQNQSEISAEVKIRWQLWWQTQADSLQLKPEHQALCLQLIRECASAQFKQLGSDQHCFSLSQLNAINAWPEMGFTFKTHGVSTSRIDHLIGASLHANSARPALKVQQLNGLLTGFMDIVFEHEGRYFVLDYKSNKLPDYSQKSIAQSMLSHRYEVQYTLYVLALHRLLKSRLTNYNYEQHVGGAIYLYLRGIDQVGQGVYVNKPPYDLIRQLDEAFQLNQHPVWSGVTA
jgi:exodeoxyribonuclease V beta subunit